MDPNTIPEQLQKLGSKIMLTSEEQARLFETLQNVSQSAPAPSPAEPVITSPYARTLSLFVRASFASLIIILGTGTGFVAASENALPGESLYGFKVSVNEEIKSYLQPNETARLNYEVTRAGRRLAEAETLVGQGRLDVERQETIARQIVRHTESIKDSARSIAIAEPTRHQELTEAAQLKMIAQQDSLIRVAEGAANKPSLAVVLDASYDAVSSIEFIQTTVDHVFLAEKPSSITNTINIAANTTKPSGELMEDNEYFALGYLNSSVKLLYAQQEPMVSKTVISIQEVPVTSIAALPTSTTPKDPVLGQTTTVPQTTLVEVPITTLDIDPKYKLILTEIDTTVDLLQKTARAPGGLESEAYARLAQQMVGLLEKAFGFHGLDLPKPTTTGSVIPQQLKPTDIEVLPYIDPNSLNEPIQKEVPLINLDQESESTSGSVPPTSTQTSGSTSIQSQPL